MTLWRRFATAESHSQLLPLEVGCSIGREKPNRVPKNVLEEPCGADTCVPPDCFAVGPFTRQEPHEDCALVMAIVGWRWGRAMSAQIGIIRYVTVGRAPQRHESAFVPRSAYTT